MKKLFLKNGMDFNVRCSEAKGSKCIEIYDYDENTMAVIYSTGETTVYGKKFKNYELLAIAEIIENFNQFFNNLNQ